MRWQRGLDRPLQLGKILFAEDFFYCFILPKARRSEADTPTGKRPSGTEFNPHYDADPFYSTKSDSAAKQL